LVLVKVLLYFYLKLDNKPFTPAEERYCKYCLNQVENEKHFLLYCPLYNCIRESFQSILKNSQNSTEDNLLLQIINPINPQDTKDIYNVFIYQRIIHQKRNI
jgi:hypothetical protein